jgi:dTMP kinase
VRLLVEALERAGIAATSTREPGGSPGAEAIRQLLLGGDSDRWDAIGEALLLYAARRDHVARTIRPALDRGAWVVCDRFNDSTLAYQGYGRGLPLDRLAMLQELAMGDFGPDLTLMLDMPVAEGLERAAKRAESADRFERLDQSFHERLRVGFLAIAAAEPERCVVIDAMGSVDDVHKAIATAVAARLRVTL